MKKKILPVTVVAVVAVCGILIVKSFTGAASMPYKDLSANDIRAVTVEILPRNDKADLSDDTIKELAAILRKVETYNQDNSHSEYGGQAVIYTLTMTDGVRVTISAFGSFIIIDGIGYKTKSEPLQELIELGETIVK